MKRHLGIIALFTLLTNIVFAETVCSPRLPESIDPHQLLMPLEKELSSRLYSTLIPTVAAKWNSKDQKTWNFVLNENISFKPVPGWKGGKVTAKDVEFSINRQLTRKSATLFDERTFLPAKLSGLDSNLAAVKVISPLEISLTFKETVSEDQLKKIFSSQMGFVISSEYASALKAKGQKLKLFPSTTEYTLLDVQAGYLAFTQSKAGKLPTLVYKEVMLVDSKKAECEKTYYATTSYIESLKASKARFKQEKISRTKLSLIVNPGVGLPEGSMAVLHTKLAPEKLSALKGLKPFKGAFTPTSKIWSTDKKFGLPPKEMQLFYCEAPTLHSLNMDLLLKEIGDAVKSSFNITLREVKTNCSLLPSYINDPTVFITLSAVNYQSEEELASMFSCFTTKRPFGICVKDLSKKEIDLAFNKANHIIPLIDEEDFLVKF